MWIRRALRLILLVFTSTEIVSCLQKGSLTYVIDTTPSMTAEINQVKQSTDSITQVVFDEKSSQINNMVLVTFSDPNADLRIVTDNRNVFKQYINQVGIIWPNVYDCPEMSMAGTLLALKHSLPGSYIYVFTDASAKDFDKSNEVLKMCQEKQSQIVFILTGDCNDFETHPYQVYFDIAAGCSGLAFYIQKNDVFSIFEPIKDAIKGKKELITSRTIPAHTTKDIPFEIKDESEYASVTASGKGVTLKVRGTTHLDFQTETLTWLNNVKMLRLSRLKPGTYIATVHSSSLTTISIFSRTDFSFDYGFSGLDAQTLNDTLPQPIPNTSTRLFVTVSDPKHTTDIKSVLILDMHENVIPNFNLPLRQINDNYYVTPAFVAPSSSFKIAIYGKAVKTGKDIIRLARFPITPQPAEKVYVPQLSGKTSESVNIGTSVDIECTATKSVPAPKITWEFMANGNSKFVPIRVSDNVLHIKTVHKEDAGRYKCTASNIAGISEHVTTLVVKFKPSITTDNSTIYEGLEGDKTLKIPCDVDAYPPAKISWSVDGLDITNGPHYSISDGALIISNPKNADSKTYKCKATNDLGSSHAEFNVKVKGIPYINSNDSKSYKGLDGDVALRIPCDAVSIPPPIISWSVNGKKITSGPHYSISGGVLIIKDPKIVDSGSYRCEATNYLGSTHADFDIKINEHLDDYGPIEEIKINKLKNTSFRLECGLPGQSVRWFLEGVDINVKGNYLEITDFDEAYNGNYTCRVSDMEKSFTKTFHLVIDGPPKFQFEQEDPIVDWNGIDELNCNIESTKNVRVEWTFNGEVLSDHTSLMLGVGGKWGHYTCNVSNDFGAIQRTFDVISSRCLVPKDQKEYGHMPIILNERSTWPTTASGNYIIFEHGEKITVYCANDNGKENRLKNFPTLKEITALCDKQDTFIVNGKPYKITEMGCDHYITPTIIFENKRCGKGKTKSIAVGYNNVPSFMETYEVCYDTLNNMPQYSLVVKPRNHLSRDVDYKWYKHPKINFKTDDSVYTCKDSTSECCYSKSQLVSARDFSPGPAQSTTFIESINSIPLWQPCHKPTISWDDIDEKIRWQLDLLPASVVWSGTHMMQKKNGHLVPRYLFKLVEFIDSRPIAIVYVNGPSPTNADIYYARTFVLMMIMTSSGWKTWVIISIAAMVMISVKLLTFFNINI